VCGVSCRTSGFEFGIRCHPRHRLHARLLPASCASERLSRELHDGGVPAPLHADNAKRDVVLAGGRRVAPLSTATCGGEQTTHPGSVPHMMALGWATSVGRGGHRSVESALQQVKDWRVEAERDEARRDDRAVERCEVDTDRLERCALCETYRPAVVDLPHHAKAVQTRVFQFLCR